MDNINKTRIINAIIFLFLAASGVFAQSNYYIHLESGSSGNNQARVKVISHDVGGAQITLYKREFIDGLWTNFAATSFKDTNWITGTDNGVDFYKYWDVPITGLAAKFYAHAYPGGNVSSNYVTYGVFESKNGVLTKTYDNNGIIGQSVKYFDDAGQLLQSQIWDKENNEVFANEPLRDNLDRVVGQTLSAPIDESVLGYKQNFVTVNGGELISEEDFEHSSIIDKGSIGTLGHFYSENSIEERVAETGLPYSVSNFYEDGSGESKSASMPGDLHHLQSGRVGIQKTMSALDGELRYYGELRELILDLLAPSISSKIIKKVVKDGNGNEAVSYQDDAGNAIASAVGGDDIFEVTLQYDSEKSTFEHHVGNAIGYHDINLLGGGEKVIEVTDLETNQVINDETIDGSGSFQLNPGFYKINYSAPSNSTGESMVLKFNYSSFSYHFYDNKGRLVASMTPRGTEEIIANGGISGYTKASLPFTTLYEYDFQGRLESMAEPDAGTTEYRYRKDGQIRFSKNATQTSTQYSYTDYDDLGRPVESGECDCSVNFDQADVDNVVSANSKTDWIKTYYDVPIAQPSVPSEISSRIGTQQFVRGAVSSTENEEVQSWYSYDDQGRVTWFLQLYKDLNKYVLIEYTYDFLGNVLMVALQPQTEANVVSEAFYHHYAYDANQRLKTVHTSILSPDHPKYDPYLQAKYIYALHGPLERVELATDLQGIDYTYTVQGWLKAINHPELGKDPGYDGIPDPDGNVNEFSKDAFGMTLEYFEGDYTNANTLIGSAVFGTDIPEQNNGNIRSAVFPGAQNGEYVIKGQADDYETASYDPNETKIYASNSLTFNPGFDTGGGLFEAAIADYSLNDFDNVEAYAYKYDEKYQLKEAIFGKSNDMENADNAYNVNIASDDPLKEAYDANGNIQGIKRYGEDPNNLKSDFEFHYKPGTNQLESVDDYITSMTYNAIGQVESIDYHDAEQQDIDVEYDVTGKVTRVLKMGTNDELISFTYDDRGFRMMKQVGDVQEWYVRDASGQVMAIYHGTTANSDISQIELPIYGASKLGMAFKNPDHYKYIYELTDHLGSVRAIITKLSLQATATMEPENNGYESQFFDNIGAPDNDAVYSYNDPSVPGHSALTNPALPIGPTTTLRIKAGDEINLDVFVKYAGISSATPAAGGIADLLDNTVNDNAVGVEGGGLTSSLTSLLPGLIAAVSGTSNEPKAYLQYILLDENFDYITSESVPVTGAGDANGWEQLVLSTSATQDGYLFAYVVNESNFDIHFDNFTFSILGARVIRKSDYYPFGAVAKVWNNPEQTQQEKYRHGYQGQYSEQDSTTGWNAFELRMYDPLIGRWLQVDPARQYASSYVGMGNNPISGVDPDGGFNQGVNSKGEVVFDDGLDDGNVFLVNDGFTGEINDLATLQANSTQIVNDWVWMGTNSQLFDYVHSQFSSVGLNSFANYEIGNDKNGFAVDVFDTYRNGAGNYVVKGDRNVGNWRFMINNIPSTKNSFLGDVYSLRNALAHEKGHVLLSVQLSHGERNLIFKSAGARREYIENHAIDFQRNHPSYLFTSPRFENVINAYSKYNQH